MRACSLVLLLLLLLHHTRRSCGVISRPSQGSSAERTIQPEQQLRT